MSFSRNTYIFELENSSDIICNLENTTEWQIVAVYHNVEDRKTEVASIDNSTGHVFLHEGEGFTASYNNDTELSVKLNKLSCNSKGEYICAIIAGSLENPVANVSSTAFVNVVGMYYSNTWFNIMKKEISHVFWSVRDKDTEETCKIMFLHNSCLGQIILISVKLILGINRYRKQHRPKGIRKTFSLVTL